MCMHRNPTDECRRKCAVCFITRPWVGGPLAIEQHCLQCKGRGVIPKYDFLIPDRQFFGGFLNPTRGDRMKIIPILILSMLLPISAFAATCTGIVLDDVDEPVIGANIVIKGTTNGTSTDIDGKFSLPNCNTGNILVVSYIGYETTEFCVGDQKQFQIGLCLPDGFEGQYCGTSTNQGTNCSSGGGGCTVLPCSACQTSAWTEISPGYESRQSGGTCSGNSCTSNGTCSGQITEYRCADGYIGSTTNGTSGCYLCGSGCCGFVRDQLGLMAGVNILIKGTQTGTISDLNGFFSLAKCDAGNVLQFAYIGYARQDITVTSSNIHNMNITMTEDLGDGACAEGYYMDWSTGHSKCIRCPSQGGIAGTIPASNDGALSNGITNCYLPRGSTVQDLNGTFQYTSNCYYR